MSEKEIVDKIAEQIWLAHETMTSDDIVLPKNHVSWWEQKKYGTEWDTNTCLRHAKLIYLLQMGDIAIL